MRLATDDLLRCLRWEEAEGLLLLNNGNDYTGSGNICFTTPGAMRTSWLNVCRVQG
jgi:hypothetical protein